MSQLIQRVPNYFTFLRVALIPVFVLLMMRELTIAALFVFLLASLTDLIDGYVARRYRAVSDFGKLLDPIADKILVMTALVMLVAQKSDTYGESWVPGWMVVLVLARETWVNGLRSVAAAQGVVVAASSAGKLKSALQMIAIVLLLLHDAKISVAGLSIPCSYLGVRLLLISIIVSIWGAVEYSWFVLSGKMKAEKAPGSDGSVCCASRETSPKSQCG